MMKTPGTGCTDGAALNRRMALETDGRYFDAVRRWRSAAERDLVHNGASWPLLGVVFSAIIHSGQLVLRVRFCTSLPFVLDAAKVLCGWLPHSKA